jgi:hypothetical protein
MRLEPDILLRIQAAHPVWEPVIELPAAFILAFGPRRRVAFWRGGRGSNLGPNAAKPGSETRQGVLSFDNPPVTTVTGIGEKSLVLLSC